MSENKVERTVQVIHEEYSKLCAQSGHTLYQLGVLESEIAKHEASLAEIHEKLKALNLEAAELTAKAKSNE